MRLKKKTSRSPGGSSGSTRLSGPSRSPGSSDLRETKTTRTNSQSRRGGHLPKNTNRTTGTTMAALIGKPFGVRRRRTLVGISKRRSRRAETCAEARSTTSCPEEFRRVQGVDRPDPESAKQSNKTPRARRKISGDSNHEKEPDSGTRSKGTMQLALCSVVLRSQKGSLKPDQNCAGQVNATTGLKESGAG
jgi:hypothetical protein